MQELLLDALREGHTIITPDSAGYFIENCKVCFQLQLQHHQSGVVLRVEYNDKEFHFRVTWQGNVTPSMLRAWQREDKKTTEIGAIALTMLLLPAVTNYRSVESTGYGTGVDYVLVDEPLDDTLLFNNMAAYLEITGIARQTQANTVNDRISEKKARINKIKEKDVTILGGLPTVIACVEFSTPLVRIITHE